MSLRKISKNISAVMVANFVVAGIGTSNSVFAGQEEGLNKYPKRVEAASSGGKETVNRTDDFKEKASEFEKVEQFVRSLLNKRSCLDLGAKDASIQLTVTYFYGMLRERNNSSKGSKQRREDLYELEKEVKLYLDSLYKYKLQLEKEEEEKRKASEFNLWSWIANLIGIKSHDKGDIEKIEGNKYSSEVR